jgi:hypothetical protein
LEGIPKLNYLLAVYNLLRINKHDNDDNIETLSEEMAGDGSMDNMQEVTSAPGQVRDRKTETIFLGWEDIHVLLHRNFTVHSFCQAQPKPQFQ